MNDDRVDITWAEVVGAAHVGVSRFAVAYSMNGANKSIRKGWIDIMALNIGGAVAELGVCSAMGCPWDMSNGRFHNAPDIPPDWEVRWTPHPGGHLIVHEDDHQDRRYILVTGQPPDMRIRGWMPGELIRNPAWARRPATSFYKHEWWIPPDALKGWFM